MLPGWKARRHCYGIIHRARVFEICTTHKENLPYKLSSISSIRILLFYFTKEKLFGIIYMILLTIHITIKRHVMDVLHTLNNGQELFLFISFFSCGSSTCGSIRVQSYPQPQHPHQARLFRLYPRTEQSYSRHQSCPKSCSLYTACFIMHASKLLQPMKGCLTWILKHSFHYYPKKGRGCPLC